MSLLSGSQCDAFWSGPNASAWKSSSRQDPACSCAIQTGSIVAVEDGLAPKLKRSGRNLFHIIFLECMIFSTTCEPRSASPSKGAWRKMVLRFGSGRVSSRHGRAYVRALFSSCQQTATKRRFWEPCCMAWKECFFWGVFGACRRCTLSEVSERGITVRSSVSGSRLEVSSLFLWVILFCQDLANQIRHWDVYNKEVKQHASSTGPGLYLNPSVAEWFSGSPCMVQSFASHFIPFFDWLLVAPYQACLQGGQYLDQELWPWRTSASHFQPVRRAAKSRSGWTTSLEFVREAGPSKLKCISLFTGVGGLELGLRQWCRHVFHKIVCFFWNWFLTQSHKAGRTKGQMNNLTCENFACRSNSACSLPMVAFSDLQSVEILYITKEVKVGKQDCN